MGEKLYKEGIPYKLITRWQPQMDFCVPKHSVKSVLDVLHAAEDLDDDSLSCKYTYILSISVLRI